MEQNSFNQKRVFCETFFSGIIINFYQQFFFLAKIKGGDRGIFFIMAIIEAFHLPNPGFLQTSSLDTRLHYLGSGGTFTSWSE